MDYLEKMGTVAQKSSMYPLCMERFSVYVCVEEKGIMGILLSSSPMTLQIVPDVPQIFVAIQFSKKKA